MYSGFATVLKRLVSSASLPYVCFVRKQQSGYELCRELGITMDTLWRYNPEVPDFESVWGGQLLLVPHATWPSQRPWEDSAGSYSLTPWHARAEDFTIYPQKDRCLDPHWEPPRSTVLTAISGTVGRGNAFGTFTYVDDTSGDPDGIRITGGWESANIGMVQVPGLAGLNSRGGMQFYKKCHRQLQGLWGDWVKYGMRRHILTFDGSFNPRYMRKASHIPDHLSNHAWGTAFDINAKWNPLGTPPVHLGTHGSVMDLVEIAHKWGFYWGGHFGSHRWDGMHFEVAKIL
ncbi:MAG TPA: M15 family metallopeptidase [Bryobacteraceae bacterium]|jgi:hypothetical protein